MGDTGGWSAFPIGEEPAHPRVEFPETGWGMLVAWVAGPAHVVRSREVGPVPPVRVTLPRANGARTITHLERTRTDQAAIDTGIDAYLREAGVPAQPVGYRWFLWSAAVDEQEFWAVAERARLAAAADSPREARTALRAVLPALLDRRV